MDEPIDFLKLTPRQLLGVALIVLVMDGFRPDGGPGATAGTRLPAAWKINVPFMNFQVPTLIAPVPPKTS